MTKRSDGGSGGGQKKLRCAIYTRKSSEEGLEQDFNSLDAQREACEAFVASQRNEGWNILPDMYDDGGFSGGTIERPAFQRLLSDVNAGKVDVVVVYKVDRLTRSLSDFAKIVDVFDKNAVSFVSVTQQFNTTSSMGRLTLNILLSFAQFEREVTGERIRDKIAASKKKGMWMGGLPPLGFDVRDRKLVVNADEATTVRSIFRRYAELKSVRLLKADLDASGIVSKARGALDGTHYGQKPFARGALYLMLQNRTYRGEIVHKDKSYPAEHDAIIDEPLWNEVQSILAENRVERILGVTDQHPSLLADLVVDASGEQMTPTHTTKNGVRYRYYVSRTLLTGSAKNLGQRIPASSLESLIRQRIRDWLGNPTAVLEAIKGDVSDAASQQQLMENIGHYVATWDELKTVDLRKFVLAVVVRIHVNPDQIEIVLNPVGLVRWFSTQDHRDKILEAPLSGDDTVTLPIPASLRRVGKEMRIIVEDTSSRTPPDAALVRVLIRADTIRNRVLASKSLTLDEIAKAEGMTPSYATRLFRLTLLAPDIVSAILSGNHPPQLTARKLMDDTRLPLDWNDQRRSLGFS